MRNTTIAVIFLFYFCIISHFSVSATEIEYYGSTPAIDWQKCLGGSAWDYGQNIRQTSDGGYIGIGYTSSSNGDVIGGPGSLYDIWIVKLANNGSISWQKSIGDLDNDRGYDIQETSDGGYIVAGTTDINDAINDFWILKLTDTRNISWQKTFGGYGDDVPYSIQQTTDGGYIIAGYTKSTDGQSVGNHGGYDFLVLKLSSSGSLSWKKCFGGSSDDKAKSIKQTNDGGYIVAGYTSSTNGNVIGNHGSNDYWVLKLTDSGNITWNKCFGGTGDDQANQIQQTRDGGYIVAGYTYSTNGDVIGKHSSRDIWVVKLTDMGDLLWQKCLGGTSGEGANSIQQTNEGGYIIAGDTWSSDGDVVGQHGGSWDDYWVVKLTGSGNISWQKCLGGTDDDSAQQIQQTSDGGYVVVGYTNSTNGDVTGKHGHYDYWVVKIRSSPIISEVFPNYGTNANLIPVAITGTDLQNITKINLTQSGQENITAINISVLSSTNIACDFPIAGFNPGVWNIEMTASDGQTVLIQNGFTITTPLSSPSAIFTVNTTSGSAPLTIQFNDNSTNAPSAWNWSFGDGIWFNTTSSELRNTSHTYSSAGTYNVTLTVSKSAGNSTSNPTLISVSPSVSIPVANFTSNLTSGPAPLTVQFTDTSTGTPNVWNWSFGNGYYANISGNYSSVIRNITYTQPGTYLVTLQVSNAAGTNITSPPTYITVTSNVTPPVANFTANLTSGTSPLTVFFEDTSTGSPNVWNWSFGNGYVRNITGNYSQVTLNVTYFWGGTYPVTLRVSNAAGTNITNPGTNITVYDVPPTANFTANVTSGTAPLTVFFNGTQTGYPTAWNWNFGNGNTANISGRYTGTSRNVTYSTPGTYPVTLQVSNSAGTYTTPVTYITVGSTSTSSPAVYSVSPYSKMNSQPSAILTIAGNNFTSNTTVTLLKSGVMNITPTLYSSIDSTQIVCTIPIYNAPTGYWDVMVTNPDGQTAILTNGFMIVYSYPESGISVTGISPPFGPNTTDQLISLYGSGFTENTNVTLVRPGIENVSFPGSQPIPGQYNQIYCTLPLTGMTPGHYDLYVENSDREGTWAPDGFTVYATGTGSDPVISGITPSSGSGSGPVTVEIQGSGFQSGAIVGLMTGTCGFIRGMNVTVSSSSMITCTLPVQSVMMGFYPLAVINPDGTGVVQTGAFEVSMNMPIAIVGTITPETANISAPFTISIQTAELIDGIGFQPGAFVTIKKDATSIITKNVWITSPTQIQCDVDPFGIVPGSYYVSVSSQGNSQARNVGTVNLTDRSEGHIIQPDQLPFEINSDTIASYGNHYWIGGNWTGSSVDTFAVLITAPDVTLNGNNFILTGIPDSNPETYQNAILVNADNVTVSSVHTTGWNQGITYDMVHTGYVGNNYLEKSLNNNIGISSSENLILSGNILTSASENGLFIGDSQDITVENNVVKDNKLGIWYHNVTSGSTLNNLVTNNGNAGIGGDICDDITIDQNTVNNNQGGNYSPGISFSESTLISVSNNIVTGNGNSGIALGKATQSSIRNNTISGNIEYGIDIFTSSEILIDGNQANNQVNRSGILVGHSNLVNLTRNNVFNNKGNGIWLRNVTTGSILLNTATNNEYIGIGGSLCSDMMVSRNTANANMGGDYSPGFLFSNSTSITVSDNVAYGNGNSGISFGNTIMSSILNNSVSGNGNGGIDIYACRDILIDENQAIYQVNNSGIQVGDSFSVNITRNEIRDNAGGGIWYHNVTGSSNAITNNNILNNTDTGIGMVMGTGPVSIRKNTISSNPIGIILEPGVTAISIADNIFNNTENVGAPSNISGITWSIGQESGPNIIDGPFIGGNYWGKPDGTGFSQTHAAGENGFTPIPFPVLNDMSNIDLLPLANQGTLVPPVASFTANTTTGNVPLTVLFTDTSTGAPTAWNWSFGDGTWFNTTDPLQRNATKTYTIPGTFIAQLQVSNTAGTNITTLGKTIHTLSDIPLSPTITGITPSTAMNSASIMITNLSGTNFRENAVVMLERTGYPSKTAYNVSIMANGTKITGKVTPNRFEQIGYWNVTVKNTDNTSATLPNGLYINGAWPTITSVSPNNAPVSGTTAFTIQGTNLWSNSTSVKLTRTGYPQINATNQVRFNSTQLSGKFTFTTATPGPYNITVTNPEGTFFTIQNGFTVTSVDIPPVAALTANTTTGYAPLPILFTDTSTGYPTAWNWSFGDGTWFNTTDPLQRNATKTYSTAGTFQVNLMVSNTAGTSITSPGTSISVGSSGPTITGITPSTAMNSASIMITNLSGTNFRENAVVMLERPGYPSKTAYNVSIMANGTKITGKVTPNRFEQIGYWNVTVKNSDNTSATLPNGLYINGTWPTITSVSPNNAPVSGTIAFTIRGTNLWSNSMSVKLTRTGYPQINATNQVRFNSTQMSGKFTLTTATPGPYNITVTNPEGTFFTLQNGFTVTSVDIPPVAALTANTTTGYAPLPILFTDTSTGSPTAWNWSFGDGTWFNTTDPLQRNATKTYSTAGTFQVNLMVSNTAGTSITSPGTSISVESSGPTITGITPSIAMNSASIMITNLSGTNFRENAVVMLERTGYPSKTAYNVSIMANGTKITGKVTPNRFEQIGYWNVTVKNTDNTSATLPNGLYINGAWPTITSVSPNNAPVSGTTAFTIQGTNLWSNSTSVKLTRTGYPQINATNQVRFNSTQLSGKFTFTTATPGPYNITVTNPEGTFFTIQNGFTVTSATIPADLVAGTISGPAAVNPVQSPQGYVNLTVITNGTVQSGVWITYYLSSDRNITSADTKIAQQYAQNLTGTMTLQQAMAVPSAMTPGSYYYGAIVDSLSKIAETNESNNIAVSAGPVTVGAIGPDLIFPVLDINETTIDIGASTTIQDCISNIGQQTAGASWMNVYLSSDKTISSDDFWVGQREVGSLNAGNSSYSADSIEIPIEYESSTAYLVGKADSTNVVNELNESNNYGLDSNPVTITNPYLEGVGLVATAGAATADITIEGVNSSRFVYPGNQTTVSFTVKNSGEAMKGVYTTWYLSNDTVVSGDDEYVDQMKIADLPGGVTNLIHEMTVPTFLPEGPYYLYAKLDPLTMARDSDRANNVAFSDQMVISRVVVQSPVTITTQPVVVNTTSTPVLQVDKPVVNTPAASQVSTPIVSIPQRPQVKAAISAAKGNGVLTGRTVTIG